MREPSFSATVSLLCTSLIAPCKALLSILCTASLIASKRLFCSSAICLSRSRKMSCVWAVIAVSTSLFTAAICAATCSGVPNCFLICGSLLLAISCKVLTRATAASCKAFVSLSMRCEVLSLMPSSSRLALSSMPCNDSSVIAAFVSFCAPSKASRVAFSSSKSRSRSAFAFSAAALRASAILRSFSVLARLISASVAFFAASAFSFSVLFALSAASLFSCSKASRSALKNAAGSCATFATCSAKLVANCRRPASVCLSMPSTSLSSLPYSCNLVFTSTISADERLAVSSSSPKGLAILLPITSKVVAARIELPAPSKDEVSFLLSSCNLCNCLIASSAWACSIVLPICCCCLIYSRAASALMPNALLYLSKLVIVPGMVLPTISMIPFNSSCARFASSLSAANVGSNAFNSS